MRRFDSPRGIFTFPDPEAWPAESVEQYRRATEPRALRDVFIFNYGDTAAMLMEDAVTALAALPVTRDSWATYQGFPVFLFDSLNVQGFTVLLEASGYRVWILERPAQQNPESAGGAVRGKKTAKGKVVSIARARHAFAGRRRWA